MMIETDVHKWMREQIKILGSMKALAQYLKISPTYLSDILAGKRNISDKLAKKCGFVKMVYYSRITRKRK